jgi:type IV secretion system protein TrbI
MLPPTGGSPAVYDRAPKPPGILPRHVQTWVVLAIAAVMTGIIAISGPSRPAEKHAQPAGAAMVVEPNEARIQEYRKRIDEEARRLVAAQAELDAAKRTLAATTTPPVGEGPQVPTGPRDAPVPADGRSQTSAGSTESSFEHEKAQREYRALFADNMALTLRQHPAPSTEHPAPSTEHPAAPSTQHSAPSTQHPFYKLPEGTIIEAVLTNRLDGSFAGPVNAMVTARVYSRDRQHTLIPQGARLLGDARAVASLGQQRLAVTFHRLLMPDGTAVTLDRTKAPEGLSQAGETGLRDQVNRHYAQLFGVSLAIGMIGGLAQAETRVGVGATGLDLYGQGVAASSTQSSLHILDRFLNVLPTVTIREGQRLKVYLSEELELREWRNGE